MPARPFLSQNNLLLGAMALLVILSLVLGRKDGFGARAADSGRAAAKRDTPHSTTATDDESSERDGPFYPDTAIPRGAVLVPLELENIRAVAGLIGHFGVIDLYGRDGAGRNTLLASRIKILQAPLNPDQYAVLAEDGLARKIMLAGGPYWGSVRNRRAIKPETSPRQAIASAPTSSAVTPAPPAHRARTRPIAPARLEVEYYQGVNP